MNAGPLSQVAGAELRSRNQGLDDTQRLGGRVGLHHW
jgi:hypothetical protein